MGRGLLCLAPQLVELTAQFSADNGLCCHHFSSADSVPIWSADAHTVTVQIPELVPTSLHYLLGGTQVSSQRIIPPSYPVV